MAHLSRCRRGRAEPTPHDAPGFRLHAPQMVAPDRAAERFHAASMSGASGGVNVSASTFHMQHLRGSERQICLIPQRLFIALALFTTAALCADFTFEIPPVPAPLEIGGQTVTITLAGELSASPQAPGPGDQTFNFNLRA